MNKGDFYMDGKQKLLLRYKEENQTAVKGEIVFAGSSLMEGLPIGELLAEHGDDTVIYNRGVGGFVTDELLAALDVCVLDLKPRRIFINIGTNDLSNPNLTIEQVMEKYDAIITAIEKALPKVEIYMMAYYPINIDAAIEEIKPNLRIRTNEKIALANAQVEQLALCHGQRYIDVNDNLKDECGRLKAEYTYEGMHIKKCGYATIYDDLMRYVKEPEWKK